LRVAKTDDQREQLINIIQQDVSRMDRLISDISKASRAFETPFAQVLRNLIDNALTFSPKDGVVTISAATGEKEGRERVIISVIDEGPETGKVTGAKFIVTLPRQTQGKLSNLGR